MSQITFFFIYLVINTITLYLISNKLLILDNSSFLKAFIVALIIGLYNSFVPKIIGSPSGFYSSMFAGIAKSLMIVPVLIFLKIIYSLSWKNFGYFAIALFIINFVTSIFITLLI